MRIETIALQNFGPHKDTHLDLRHVTASTVCGSNGAGKSTMAMDAPLWALWGECRVPTDQIMTLGEYSMGVQVIFTLNGQRYQVARTRSTKTKAGKSDLQLHVERDDGNWTPIGGKTVRETQVKIEQLLQSDYGLCTSTTFLVQGQFDHVSKATPAQRKTILCDILGIIRYRDYAVQARQRGSKAEGALTQIAVAISGLEKERERADEAKILIFNATQQLRLEREVQISTQRQMRNAAVARGVIAAEITVIREGVASGEYEQLQAKASAADRRIQGMRKDVTDMSALADLAPTLEITATQLTDVEAVLATLTIMQTANEVSVATARIGYEQARTVTVERQQHEVDLQRTIDVATIQVDQWAQQYESETSRMMTELAQRTEQSQCLSSVPCEVNLQGTCQFTKNAVVARGLIPMMEKNISERKTSIAQIQMACPQFQDLRSAEFAIAQLQPLEIDCDTMKRSYDAAVQEVQTYSVDLQTTTKKMQVLRNDLSRLPTVQHAKKTLPSLQTDLAVKIQEHDEMKAQLAQYEQARTGLTIKEAALAQKAVLVSELEELAGREASAILTITEQLATAQATLARTIEAGSELAKIEKQRDELKRDMEQYGWLTEAYKRVPILLLENALPVLENEANRVLETISSTGMSLRIETQKTLKTTNELVDTVDIIVRDRVGERPYESYSGGERMRIDLALRLGLSRLMSTRSGSKIQTLIIDEGFSSLDADGVNRMRECLAFLETEYPLVLVITHDEELKDSLGTQIIVTPGVDGSTVEVMA